MAITFTNKAAGEMRERVDKLVGSWFGEHLGIARSIPTCVRILRRYIDRLGYDTNFVIYDADDQKTCDERRLQASVVWIQRHTKKRHLLAAISKAKDELIGPEQYELDHRGDIERRTDRCYL